MLLFSMCSCSQIPNFRYQNYIQIVVLGLHCFYILLGTSTTTTTSTSCSWGRVARVYINKFSALLDNKWGRKYKGSRSQRGGRCLLNIPPFTSWDAKQIKSFFLSNMTNWACMHIDRSIDRCPALVCHYVHNTHTDIYIYLVRYVRYKCNS